MRRRLAVSSSRAGPGRSPMAGGYGWDALSLAGGRGRAPASCVRDGVRAAASSRPGYGPRLARPRLSPPALPLRGGRRRVSAPLGAALPSSPPFIP